MLINQDKKNKTHEKNIKKSSDDCYNDKVQKFVKNYGENIDSNKDKKINLKLNRNGNIKIINNDEKRNDISKIKNKIANNINKNLKEKRYN